MRISEILLPEFDHEIANTRKTIERVPEDKWTWRPHVKSMAMGDLAVHLTNIAGWLGETINKDSIDLQPGEAPETPKLTTVKDVLAKFDASVPAGRAALERADDEHLLKPWSLMSGGNAIFTLPRATVIRSFILNHLVHHRAQLAVYLRLNDVPVPALYGPSADEGSM